MRRIVGLHTFAAGALLALSATTWAAEVTRVASSADLDNPFDLDLTLGYRHAVHRGKITREAIGTSGAVEDVTELRFTQTSDLPTARLAVGLYHDLELHAEIPYVLGDDNAWRYASGVSPATSTIAGSTIDASGQTCAAVPCGIFPVGSGTTVYHGKAMGEVTLGAAWGILSERRDDTKPTWVVGLDVTLPSAAKYDPSTAPLHASKNNPGAVGRKIWQYDAWTAISRQFGAIDPYLKAHITFPALSGTSYSNCDNAPSLAAPANTPPNPQMEASAVADCAAWRGSAGPQPPRIFGLAFGTELVPYENRQEQQRVAVDVRVGADWTGQSRWYNELSDATGKLLHSDAFATLYGRAGLYLRASGYIQLRLSAAFSWHADHAISGEPRLRGGLANLNPNYDWRYDVPGRRFRIAEATTLDLGAAAVVNF